MSNSMLETYITDAEIRACAEERYPNLIIWRYELADLTTVQYAIEWVIQQLPHPFTPKLITEMHVLWLRKSAGVVSNASLHVDDLHHRLHNCGSPWRVSDALVLGHLDLPPFTGSSINAHTAKAISRQALVTRLIPVPLTELI